MGNCFSRVRRENQPTTNSQLQQLPDDDSEERQISGHSVHDIEGSTHTEGQGQELNYSYKDQHTHEMERQLESLKLELNVEKQKLILVQEAKDEQQQTLASKRQHIHDLERRILSLTEELKMEKQKLSCVQKVRDEQYETLADKSQHIEELEEKFFSLTEEVEAEKQRTLSAQKEIDEQHQVLIKMTQHMQELDRECKSLTERMRMNPHIEQKHQEQGQTPVVQNQCIQGLERRVMYLTEELHQRTQTLLSVQKENDALCTKTQELEKRLKSVNEMKKQSMLAVQKDEDEQQQAKIQHTQDLEKQIMVNEKQMKKWEQKLAAQEQCVQNLEREVKCLTDELEKKKQTLLALQEERDEQEHELVFKAQHMEELKKQAESENKKWKIEKQDLLRVQEDMVKDIFAKSQHIEELEKVEGQLKVEEQKERDHHRRVLETKTRRIQQLQEQLTSMNEEVKKERQMRLSVQEEKEKKEKIVTSKSQHIQKLKQQLSSVNEKKKEMEEQQRTLAFKTQQELERQIKCLNEQFMREKENMLSVQDNMLSAQKKKVHEQQKELAAKNQHIQELERHLGVVNEERKILQKDKEHILAANSQHIQETREELESATSELEREKKNLVSVKQEKEALLAEKKGLEEERESLRNELQEERLSKEKELRKLIQMEMDAKEHKKKLASIMEEHETLKQKLSQSLVQEEQMTESSSQSPERMSLRYFSSPQVDPTLMENHKAYFRGFFLLRTPLLLSGQPAQISLEQGQIILRCPSTNAEIKFSDLYAETSAAVKKYSSLCISNSWCDDTPIFQVIVSLDDGLTELLQSKTKLLKHLTTILSKMFKKKTQVNLQSDLFLVLPSGSKSDDEIWHVTLDNVEDCMARWKRSATFTFKAIFERWNEHSWMTEPPIGPDNLADLIEELDRAAAGWKHLGIMLKVPYHILEIIGHDCGQDCRSCMMKMMMWWLEHNTPEAKRSCIVLALAKVGKKNVAREIAQKHGLPTRIFDEITPSPAVAEHLMECPSVVQKRLMKIVDELNETIRTKHQELRRQHNVLKVHERDADVAEKELIKAKKRMSDQLCTIKELTKVKKELEKTLTFMEAEIEILENSERKERAYLLALRTDEFKKAQKQLEAVKEELEEEKKKIPPLEERIQWLLAELRTRLKENCHLRETCEKINSQLQVEKVKAEMKTKELAAAALSRAKQVEEIQVQLDSLKKREKKRMDKMHKLQENIKQKETEIRLLSQQIVTKEGSGNQQTCTGDATEHHMSETMSIELTDMNRNLVQLQCELYRLKAAMKLSQEEASKYQEYAKSQLTATKLALRWSDLKKAPKKMYRGSAVVQDTTAYIVGCKLRTVYSYHLDEDRWGEHSECPQVNPGLAIVRGMLTTVGGKVRDQITNKLFCWNGTKWMESFPSMHTPRENPALVHFDNYIIAMGGDYQKRGVELLHIPSHQWSTVTCLPSPVKHITAGLCSNDIIVMDSDGTAYKMNIELLISSMQLEESSTKHSQWKPLPKCPGVHEGPTLAKVSGQTVIVSYNGIFQLQGTQWVRVGEMSVPRSYCIVCVVSDQLVVVGGRFPDPFLPSTNAVRMGVIE